MVTVLSTGVKLIPAVMLRAFGLSVGDRGVCVLRFPVVSHAISLAHALHIVLCFDIRHKMTCVSPLHTLAIGSM